MSDQPDISKSRRLPRQQKGDPPLMLSRAITNLVLACCESILNLSVKVPMNDGANTLNLVDADIKQTELGTVITLPPTAVPGGASTSGGTSSGWNDRGLWVAGTMYGTNDVVQLGQGTSAGMYICLADANTNTPDSGIGWRQLSSFATYL